jgi:hypothetical protein
MPQKALTTHHKPACAGISFAGFKPAPRDASVGVDREVLEVVFDRPVSPAWSEAFDFSREGHAGVRPWDKTFEFERRTDGSLLVKLVSLVQIDRLVREIEEHIDFANAEVRQSEETERMRGELRIRGLLACEAQPD